MRLFRLNRRELLEKAMGLGVVSSTLALAPAALAAALETPEKPRRATPRAVLGPYYKRDAPAQAQLRGAGDPGLPLSVQGRIYDTRGERLPGALVEIWQTDHSGRYDLDGYRYRARLSSDSEGRYAFESVMPGHYPDRVCQHVHFLVRAPGHKPLVTQLYFASDPVFEGDPDKNFSRDPLITSRDLVRPVVLTGDPSQIHAAVGFELVLEAA